MTFAAPWVLWTLAVVVPLGVVAAVRRERRWRRAIDAFGDRRLLGALSALPTARQRWTAAALALGGLALSIVALARPQAGEGARAVRHQGADVWFLLDLSRSMTATDVAPSRLDAAKAAARTIAAALPEDRVGLLVFAGSGFLQLPATVDRSAFATFLDAASPIDVPDPATNLEAAVGVAAAVIKEGGAPASSGLVVLSDGEDDEGTLEGAIRALQSSGVHAMTVGVGTTEGTTIGDRQADGTIRPHTDWAGRVVTTRLKDDNLGDIARRTGGVYVRWDGAASVRPVVAALTHLPSRPVSGSARTAATDRYQWPLAAALVAFLLPTVPGVGRPRWRA